jgi:hypothetical protein
MMKVQQRRNISNLQDKHIFRQLRSEVKATVHADKNVFRSLPGPRIAGPGETVF